MHCGGRLGSRCLFLCSHLAACGLVVVHWPSAWALCRCGSVADVTVRTRRAEDVQACAEALAEVHRYDNYPTRWPADPAEWLTPAGLLAAWVAENDGTVQGHVAVTCGTDDALLINAGGQPAEELATVSRLFVRPAARGRRLGEALLSTATTYAHQHGMGLVLDVVAERRSAANALYEGLGWRLVGQRAAAWTTPAGVRPQLRSYVLP